jgi:phosphopantothenoylcysteine decarboxylase/phosphopantothenate--cysteine ligase
VSGEADLQRTPVARTRDEPGDVDPSRPPERNLQQVAADGVVVLGVGCGEQACGETGDGRMLEPPSTAGGSDCPRFSPKCMLGQHVLVSAGPTYEAIDPVRGLTNLSSGKMGFAIAAAAAEAGATLLW